MPTMLHTLQIPAGSGFLGSASAVDTFMKATGSKLALAITTVSVTQTVKGGVAVLDFLFSYSTAGAAEMQALKDLGRIMDALKGLAVVLDAAALEVRLVEVDALFESPAGVAGLLELMA